MISNQIFFKGKKILPADKFLENVLFDKKKGYYSSQVPFGVMGDFVTAPGVSNLFSEMIGVWLVSTWKTLGEPKKFNFIELGPGDGSLIKNLISVSKKFSKFHKSLNIYLYEKSKLLKNLQKKNIQNSKVKWIKDFDNIKKGPVIFFGNEFFDSIPIKQFICKKKIFYEKNYQLNRNNKIVEVYKKSSEKDLSQLKKFKTLKNLNFIEFPKKGLRELNKIKKKILELNGGILLIDYGYLGPNNLNTLQSVFKHKKNRLLKNLGKADITSLVNFSLLREYFIKNNFKVKKTVTQKFFLEKMGIVERSNILANRMSFSEQSNLFLRLKRLLDNKFMGSLFKVFFAYKSKRNNFLGFN